MKLSIETINILKNFASINKSIFIANGNVVTTINEARCLIGVATIKETLPEFALYDLNIFLGAYSYFKSPIIKFNEKNLVIIDESNDSMGSVMIWYADKEVVLTPTTIPVYPRKKIPSDVEFVLTDVLYKNLQKFYHTLQLSSSDGCNISVNYDGKNNYVTIGVSAKKEAKTSNRFESVVDLNSVAECSSFNFLFNGDYLSLLSGDYDVSISRKLISKFSHKELDLQYLITLDSDSIFED